MITFNFFFQNKQKQTITMNLNNTILDLKKHIIQLVKEKKYIIENLKDFNYIDIDFKLEKSIRAFGKMNLESGIIPRTMDNITFDNYNLDNKMILCEFIIVYDFIPIEINTTNKKNYLPPIKQNKVENKPKFNLDSKLDFPTL